MSKKPELWAVISDLKNWMVIDIVSGRKKVIGRIQTRGINYYDRAIKEAIHRNKRATGIAGYVFIAELHRPSMDLRKYLNYPIRRDS